MKRCISLEGRKVVGEGLGEGVVSLAGRGGTGSVTRYLIAILQGKSTSYVKRKRRGMALLLAGERVPVPQEICGRGGVVVPHEICGGGGRVYF